jgi:catechol 2,3-dioxygenase-like lactoylglutathione lyase family enzyme
MPFYDRNRRAAAALHVAFLASSHRHEDEPDVCAWHRRTGGVGVQPWYSVPDMDWKIELVAIPVTDVDRAKAFYVEQAGFHADHDHQVNDALRFVQLTPPGSACSIVLGTGITQMPPGSQKGVQCVVADAGAARRELLAHGVDASDVDVQPWGSFVTFSDPDGNTWTLQQLPPSR